MNFFQELLGVNTQPSRPVGGTTVGGVSSEPIIISNRIPFSQSDVVPQFLPDPRVAEVIDDIEITHDHLRSSTKLRELLGEMASKISLFHCWGKQTVKVRLNSFMTMLVEQLCIPTIMSIVGIGNAPSDFFSQLLKAQPSTLAASSDDDAGDHRINTLQRIKYILKEAFTLFKLSEEALLDMGMDDDLDARRFHLFICMMDLKCNTFLSHAATIREHATPALIALSCHLLSVSAVTQCILKSIEMVVARLSNALTSDTVNFTIIETLPTLKLIVIDYFKWLRDHYTELVKLCRKEEILTAVDKSVRAWLKGENYRSPQDLLHVYHAKYKEMLTHMPIPLQPYRSKDVEQAKKDLVREVVSLNKILYKGGVHSSQLHPPSNLTELEHQDGDRKQVCRAVKDELQKILLFMFELDEYSMRTNTNSASHGSISTRISSGSSGIIELCGQSAGRAIGQDHCLDYHSDDTDSESILSNNYKSNSILDEWKMRNTANRSNLNSSSGANDIAVEVTANHVIKNPQRLPRHAMKKAKSVPVAKGTVQNSIADWPIELLDTLNSYTLLAASRTFAAGDAFLILNDLYGGEGLTLCPTYRTRTGPNCEESDTTIAITTTGIKVMLKERYNLFVEQSMHQCSDTATLKPLMRFECTTTTLIILAAPAVAAAAVSHSASHSHATTSLYGSSAQTSEVLALHPANPASAIVREGSSRNPSTDGGMPSAALVAALDDTPAVNPEVKRQACFELFQLLISNPEQLCHRAVSIEPYL